MVNTSKMVLSYGGYYSTGGSIARDILRETSSRIDFHTEFRLLKEKGGLFDLIETIIEHRAPENIDLALREFHWLATQFSKPGGFLRKTGFGYDKLSGGVFSQATKEYLDAITDYSYPLSWHYQRFKANYFTDAYWQLSDKFFALNHRQKNGRFQASMVNDNWESLLEKTQDYLNKITNGIRAEMGLPASFPLGLHNSVPPFKNTLIDRAKLLLPGLKIILTDRDPRDIYINYPKDSYARYLPNSLIGDEKVRAFCRFFRSLREERDIVSNRSDVLFMYMEDICINTEARIKDIFDFIELDQNVHTNPKSYFDPDQSMKNIGMWKTVTGDAARANSIIEEELSEFLYDV